MATANQVTDPEITNRIPAKDHARNVQMGNSLAKRKLNMNSGHLQERLQEWVGKFLERVTYFSPSNGERIDYPRYGMLSELLAKTPCRVYDLPELKARCDTAFVDTTSRMYISDTFFLECEKEQLEGKNSLFFIFQHEMEHLRRMHFQRMLDFPHSIANEAQDIRINIDLIKLTVGDGIAATKGTIPSRSELDSGVEAYYLTMGNVVRSGLAMQSIDQYRKWNGMSEESIATELMKEYTQPPKNGSKEVSFPHLCEGAAQDLDAMEILSKTLNKKNPQLEAALKKTSLDTRAAGKAKGKLTTQQLMDLYSDIDVAMATSEMTARGLQHDLLVSAAVGTGVSVKSVNSGDDFVDSITPIERLSSLKQIIEMILNPNQSASDDAENQADGMKIKDLELPRSNPKPSKSKAPSGDNPDGQSEGPSTYTGDEHVMTAEELADILHKSGLHEAAKALGYDDLEKIREEEKASKVNVSGAINQAAEDVSRLGGVYRGGHMVDYAIAQLNDFYKPVMSWAMSMQKIIEGVGNSTRFDHDEPWSQYYSSPSDQGLDSIDDIGYLGSRVMGSTSRPLVVNIIDSSASVTDRKSVV